MQSSNPAISVRNLSKCYKLGTIGRHTLVDECQYLWHKLRGRDPRQHMTKIGHTATEARKVEAEQEGNQEFWALKDVSFDVQPGEVVGIVGRNGAGKSTLLKLLTRITEPTSGEVVINGRVASLLEVGTGFHPELTGRENVYMSGTILGMKKREIDSKFDEIIAFAEIQKFIDTPVKRYSSGMYVRLAFAVAAHLEPEILLVDEVLAVGDASFQNKCLGKMRDVAGNGRTVLFVSHNMPAINSLCSKAVLLENGSVAHMGKTMDVVDEYLHAGRQQSLIDLRNRTDRSGRGRIRLVGVRVLDRDGRERSHLQTGTDLSIELRYRSTGVERLGVVSVALNICDKSGTIVFSCWNDLSGDVLQNLDPQGKLICDVPRIPLPQGVYGLNVALVVDKDLEDKISDVAKLVINEGDFFGTGKILGVKQGLVLVKHGWRASGGSVDD